MRQTPYICTLDLTHKCNLKCIHCNRNAGRTFKRELPVDTWLKVMDELLELFPSSSPRVFVFGGGEPFLVKKKLFKILKYVREYIPPELPLEPTDVAVKEFLKLKSKIVISTNATLITDDVIDELKRIKPDIICVSLDATSEKIHKLIRGISLESVLRGIKKLSKYFLIRVGFVVSTLNIYEAPSLINFVHRMNIKFIRFIPLYPIGRATTLLNYIPSPTQYYKLLAMIEESINNLEDPPHVEVGLPRCYYVDERLVRKIQELKPPITIESHECTAFFKQISINPEGFVTGCCQMNVIPYFYIGNIRQERINEIWNNSEKVINFRNFLNNRENYLIKCRGCNLWNWCRGGCRACSYAIYESLYDIDPRCSFRGRK